MRFSGLAKRLLSTIGFGKKHYKLGEASRFSGLLILPLVILLTLLPISTVFAAPEDFESVMNAEIKKSQMADSASADIPSDYFDLQKKKIFRWNDQTKTILVYIADGSHLQGWNPENPRLVKAAFSEWEKALDGRLHFIYMPDERGSDVKIKWVTRISENFKGGEAIGINEFETWGKYISKDDISIALYDSRSQLIPDTLIQSVALHEIGHMLGLKAHSDNPNDAMYASSNSKEWFEVHHLSQRDINTLKKVYISKADYMTPEKCRLSNFDKCKKGYGGRGFSILWASIPGVPVPVPIPLPF